MQHQVPKRASREYAHPALPDTQQSVVVTRRRPFWRYVILVVLLGLSLYTFYLRFVLPLWQGMSDQWHYGDNRITVFDGGDIGHGGDSEFLGLVWENKIVVVEVVNGKATTYNTIGESIGVEKPLVLLSLADVNADGKPDVVVHIENTDIGLVLYNTGTAFSLARP